MKYNFTKHDVGQQGKKFCGLTIRERYIAVSSSLKELLSSDLFSLEYDIKNSALRITPSSDEQSSYKLRQKSNGTILVGSTISKIMPIGRYYFKEKVNGYILIKGEK